MTTANNKQRRFIEGMIAQSGPISLSAYMRLCLLRPDHGYYTTGNPIGQDGDFITAPEISQMFGEMIGVWAATRWQGLGSPNPVDIVEFGPGRGTLMADAWRVLGKVPGLADAANLHLLEASLTLRAQQADRLAHANPEWIRDLGELPDSGPPVLMIGNEFLDALPITQYQKADGAWHEREIGLVDGQFAFGLSPTPMPEANLPPAIADAPEGAIWEVNFGARQLIAEVADLLKARGGAALFIDYGYADTQTGDTFQAVAGHRFADPFADPGHADLTAHVDFGALGEIARERGLNYSLTTQAQFLADHGIGQRAHDLASKNPEEADTTKTAFTRLTASDQMGELFKVMTLSA
ncbi:class I SAM-dependent methyltransferase [Cucumibacter marinus]|uniref:class I SAM-dependent methyltransferase n=1 Tax=Cucumibacter marinus TaxID=1121252 RepID=UPI00040BDE94|nr:SAM-dependent methyltransferase [Cucumibacter marinus]